MPKTIEIDLLSEDANIRQNSMKLLKRKESRTEQHDRMKRLVADLSKPKAMAATA